MQREFWPLATQVHTRAGHTHYLQVGLRHCLSLKPMEQWVLQLHGHSWMELLHQGQSLFFARRHLHLKLLHSPPCSQPDSLPGQASQCTLRSHLQCSSSGLLLPQTCLHHLRWLRSCIDHPHHQWEWVVPHHPPGARLHPLCRCPCRLHRHHRPTCCRRRRHRLETCSWLYFNIRPWGLHHFAVET